MAGLAAACRLAAQGWKVTVWDPNPYPGGKMAELHLGPYRWDAGPSLFTQPGYLEDVFRACGKRPEDYFSYSRLKESSRYFWPDGTRFTAWTDPGRLAAEAEAQGLATRAEITRALRKARRIYNITHHVFLERSLHRWGTYLRWPTLLSILRLPQIDALRTLNQANTRLFKDARMVQLFNRYATYNGSDPYRAPATLGVIPHLELGKGTYLPHGGMVQIPQSLARLAQDLGVDLRLGQGVEQITLQGKVVTGVTAGGKNHRASLVVSNADALTTYRKLLPGARVTTRQTRQERSTSGVVFYWGISRSFSELGLHNLFFSGDYAAEFAWLFGRGEMPDQLTVYVNITSKQVPTDAPAGHENWFVMVNAPSVLAQDDAALVQACRQRVLRLLSHTLGVEIEPLITQEDCLTPGGIARRTGSPDGALYGTASNHPLAAFLRHPYATRRYRGLRFVGGSVHPGGGIPLCLQSARIAIN